jgi:hypothetical protein
VTNLQHFLMIFSARKSFYACSVPRAPITEPTSRHGTAPIAWSLPSARGLGPPKSSTLIDHLSLSLSHPATMSIDKRKTVLITGQVISTCYRLECSHGAHRCSTGGIGSHLAKGSQAASSYPISLTQTSIEYHAKGKSRLSPSFFVTLMVP